MASGAATNLTDDNYFDTNPVWSPDGNTILYNRRIGGYQKIFLIDAADPSRKTQLTYGASADIGYPTPGSFGSKYGVDLGLEVITLEIPFMEPDQAWAENRAALRFAVDLPV